MNTSNDSQNFTDLLEQGITAARSGHFDLARSYLVQAAKCNPSDPQPWLWLSATTNDPARQRQCLQKALDLDPHNQGALIGLSRLNAELQSGTSAYRPAPRESIPVGESAGGETLQPKSMYPFQVDQEEAKSIAFDWLGKSSLGIKDTRYIIENFQMKAVLYPYWVFSGQANVTWRCRVLESDGESHDFHFKTGDEIIHFENIVVPASEQVESKILDKLEPYERHHLEPYTADTAGNATVLPCDRESGMASALARMKMGCSDHPEIKQRVLPGQSKHDLQVQVGEWVWEEHDLLLMPIWLIVYSYEGKPYRIHINGQTGKISGVKPYLSPNIQPMLVVLGIFAAIIVIATLFTRFSGVLN